MEVFGLVAKLTLDSDEYSRALREAESEGSHIDDPASPSLDLDKDPFDEKVLEAENEHVDDPDSPELDLDNEPFKEKLDEATTESETFASSIGQIWDGIKGMMVAAGITAVVGGLINSLTEAVDLARSVGDNIDKSSRAMSISTDAYQEWSHVLDINGASITDLNRGLMNMRKILGGGEVTDEIKSAFDALKINPSDYKSTEDMLTSTLKKLADFDASTDEKRAQRDYLTQAIFGRGGNKLNAMLDGTSKDIDDLIQQAHDLGLVMSEESVANAAAYNDAVTNMNASIEAFRVSLVEGALPALTEVANTVARIVAFLNPRTAQKSLSDMFGDSDQKFADELATIEGTSVAAESLADKLLAMGNTGEMTAEQYAIWKGTAEELIALVPSLGAVIDTETGQIDGNSDSIKENIKQWENLAKQKALQTLKEEKYQAIMQKNKDLIDKSVEANAKAAKTDAERIKSIDGINAVLKKYGVSEENLLGKEATDFDVMGARSKLTNALFGDEYQLANALSEFSSAESAFATARGESEKAKQDVEKLTAELEAGKSEYEEWLAAAEAMYGGTAEQAQGATSDVSALKKSIDELPKRKSIILSVAYDMPNFNLPPKAKGDWNVPYDMPVLVHRGETILNASRAREYREGQGNGLDYAQVASIVGHEVRKAMERVSVNMSGEKVGDLTTKRVKNNINASSYSKLRAKGG